MIELRPYQHKGIKMLYDAIREGHKRICWTFPTGAGKSTITSRFVKSCVKNEKRVLFFVHSKELVGQFAARLSNQFRIPSGIIMSGVTPNAKRLVQVASVKTLVRRKMPPADVVIIDECHRSKAKTYQKVIKHYPESILIGLTATPFRGDGKGLKDIFEIIVHPVKIRELINMGFLVGTKVYGPAEAVDVSGVRTIAGDYDKKELYERFSDGAVTRGVVDNYIKNANGKKTIVFNVNVEHSKEMDELFNSKGIASAHLDGTTDKKERERIVRAFAEGKYQVLNNVNLFTEGFDIPDTEVVILNRATKSENAYVQMVGRGLRPFEGKSECIVLDHGGNTLRHGFVEDYDSKKFSLEDRPKKKKGELPKNKECPSCQEVLPIATRMCPCGFEFKRKEKTITFGERTRFVVYDRDAIIIERLERMKYSAVKNLPLSQLRIYALLKGYRQGWWFHHAIDQGKVEVAKDHPDAFMQVKFLIELAEVEAETSELYKSLKTKRA